MCYGISSLYRNAMSSGSCKYTVVTTSSGVKSNVFQKIDISRTVLLDGCSIKILVSRIGHTDKWKMNTETLSLSHWLESIIKSANIHRKKVCLVKSAMAMYVIAFTYSLMDVNEIICILIFEHEVESSVFRLWTPWRPQTLLLLVELVLPKSDPQ